MTLIVLNNIIIIIIIIFIVLIRGQTLPAGMIDVLMPHPPTRYPKNGLIHLVPSLQHRVEPRHDNGGDYTAKSKTQRLIMWRVANIYSENDCGDHYVAAHLNSSHGSCSVAWS